MQKWTTPIFFATLLAGASNALAADLSAVSLLQRCTLQLTQTALPPSDPLITSVQNGADPIEVCIDQIFHAAKLVEESGNYVIPAATRPIGKQVLNTFHLLHSGWFHFRKPIASPVTLGPINSRMSSIYEPNAGANYFTRALFDDSVDASYFLTTQDYLRTMRDQGQVTDSIYLDAATDAASVDYLGSGVNVLYDRGIPIGIRKLTTAQRTFDTPIIPPATKSQDNYPRNIVTYPTSTITLFQHFGGGIMGLDYYLARTYDETAAIKADGVIEVPRKWGENIMKDIMCLDLPVVRESDAVPFVVPTADAPFRQASSCTACHVTIDRLAGLVKSLNYGERRTQSVWTTYVDTTRWNKGDAGDYSWSSNYRTNFIAGGNPYSNYYKEDHVGTLFYRDFSGSLNNTRVDSIVKLGEVASQQVQPYLCAAKRYYQYFTGVDVDISDPGPNPKPLTASDQAHFDFVLGLANSVMNVQNGTPHFRKLSEMVETILRSPQYRKQDFGAKP
jgi:hypothetical protein